jgi:hypothetical protein
VTDVHAPPEDPSDPDFWARLLHEGYRFRDDEACAAQLGRQPAHANRPWAELPETYRRASRESAKHFRAKLEVVGRRLAEAGSAQEAPLQADELEQLARIEHDRWWADRAADGWRHGMVRDDVRKLHPDMVPYEELSEPIRQLDRDMIERMVELLGGRGLVLVRRD